MIGFISVIPILFGAKVALAYGTNRYSGYSGLFDLERRGAELRKF